MLCNICGLYIVAPFLPVALRLLEIYQIRTIRCIGICGLREGSIMNWLRRKDRSTDSIPKTAKIRVSVEGVTSVRSDELLQSEAGKRQMKILRALRDKK